MFLDYIEGRISISTVRSCQSMSMVKIIENQGNLTKLENHNLFECHQNLKKSSKK